MPMEASPFDHHAEGATDLAGERFELWRVLSAAGREPVSLDALAAKGFRHTPTLIYELELAGHTVERVFAPGGAGRRELAGVRLRSSQALPARMPLRRPIRARLGFGRRVVPVDQPP